LTIILLLISTVVNVTT